MTLNDWFEKGMTIEQYIDSMTVNKEGMEQIYKDFALSEDDRAFYETLQSKQWRVIALTADWCTDAMLCVAVMRHIAEAAGIDMRLLIRDENLELMDQYLTNGKSRSIPIFIFIDPKGNEQAVWGPRSEEVQRLVNDMRKNLASEDDPRFKEKQREMYATFKQRLISDSSLWQTVNQDIRERLAGKAG